MLKRMALLSAAIAALFAAPAAVNAEERPAETYGMVVFLKGSEFFNWAYAGMIDAAKAIGPHVKTELHGPAEWDATLEARAIEQLVAKKVDGIIVTAGEANTLVPAINRAIRARIPVITFDSDAPASNRLCFVGTNNYQAGYEAGKAMGEWLGADARIGICTFPGPDHLKKRQDGFEAGLAEAAPGAKIVAVVNDEGDVAKAETQLTAMLQANKEINGIFGAHGNPGPGAAAAVRSLGLQGQVDIMAFDFGGPVIELIEKGEIRGTVGQNPYLMGYMSMFLAYAARHPTEVPSMFKDFGHIPTAGIDTGVRILDKETSAIYKNPPRF
ncbi:MAG: substrate-binding domain-containing protein [Planctomycetota bacterium]|nr:substrate-binding domain-containing protein [Planctomycetota bacterium]